ncbi:hypothetical protein MN116_008949, partial [Schistosoma mekongi]
MSLLSFRAGRRSHNLSSGVEQFRSPANTVRLSQISAFTGVAHVRDPITQANFIHNVSSLSSFRPVNGETISYAHLIQSNCQVSKNIVKVPHLTNAELMSHVQLNADFKSNHDSLAHFNEGGNKIVLYIFFYKFMFYSSIISSLLTLICYHSYYRYNYYCSTVQIKVFRFIFVT